MTRRVMVRRGPWPNLTAWVVLCPCCSIHAEGVIVLDTFVDWDRAVTFARAHGWVHR